MLIVVVFAVTFVVVFVVFVSTALAVNCVMFVPKVVVVEELSVTVIVFCDVFFASDRLCAEKIRCKNAGA